MIATYRKAMDALYLLCVAVAGTALVLISAVIPWAVYTRYVINQRGVVAGADRGAAHHRAHLLRRRGLLSPPRST